LCGKGFNFRLGKLIVNKTKENLSLSSYSLASSFLGGAKTFRQRLQTKGIRKSFSKQKAKNILGMA